METLIREGALKLVTSEAPCDVILSCKDKKLTAHKLILSIASPVLQDILLQDSNDVTMIILPDVEGQTMSLILEYIYHGNVTVPSYNFSGFISLGEFLNIKFDFSKNSLTENKNKDSPQDGDEVEKTKTNRKLPNLMPISSLQRKGIITKKGLYNRVFPSPWCPRVAPAVADPREGYTTCSEKLISHDTNDSNNNFKIHAKTSPKKVDEENEISQLKAINFVTSSPVQEEFEEKKLIVLEEAPINFKQETIESTYSCIKTESKESDFQDITSTKSSESEEEREQKVDKNKPFKCHDCGKSFSQLRNYKYHRSIHEGTKEFAADCPECGKIFNDRGYLSSHMKIHRDRKEYACPDCPKRFNQRVAYNMHLRIHTGVKPHECPTCGKTFSRKMLLKQHQRVHTGERPYSCPECGKSFADRSNMSLHARLHTGVKPYACNLCSKSFTKKHHLKTHMNFHTGLKPYSCQKCGLAFSQSSNMRTHYKKCVLKPSAPQST